MALSDGAPNLISQTVSQAILQVNATRAAPGKQPLTDAQIRTALATSFAGVATNYLTFPAFFSKGERLIILGSTGNGGNVELLRITGRCSKNKSSASDVDGELKRDSILVLF
jgi:hypothetical protein